MRDFLAEIAEQKKIVRDTESNLVVMILGTIGVLTIVVYGLGIIILIIAVFYHYDRKNKNKAALEQIKHLELLQATEKQS